MDAWHDIAMSLRGAYLAMHRQADAEFARRGITADQFVVLAVLADGAVRSQSAVCRVTHSEPNTMGAMLALLQTRRLVKRMRHEADRRTRTVVITDKGKRIFATLRTGREATRDRMESLFTVAEVEALLGLLRRIIQELSAPGGRGRLRKKKVSIGKRNT